jgi:hypothetical protein
MIKAPISLQDLRRKIYLKGKADSAGIGGVGPGFTRLWGYSRTTGSNSTWPESTARAIGLINLPEKLVRKPGTGKPYAGFDEAGVGNVTKGAGLRPTAKALAKPPDPTVGAPIPDPTGNRKRLYRALALRTYPSSDEEKFRV